MACVKEEKDFVLLQVLFKEDTRFICVLQVLLPKFIFFNLPTPQIWFYF
ncbi:hypothetical protein HanRHA438_Chr11g0521551 [Helianthus annuus]|nr:hypothetical protein HanRHA438_Chr11g0521551 [Helianthus annuus]